jgi:hydrogenase maturation factor HypF (carbamoyltransferase family)
MLMRPLQFHNVGFSRWLGLLLIAFILYGTTVEAAHRHGRVLPHNGDVASLTDSEKTANTTGGQTGCTDCLICQLHQNFNTTLIAFRLNDPPAQILHRTAAVVTPDLLSRISSPVAGRAPPFIS